MRVQNFEISNSDVTGAAAIIITIARRSSVGWWEGPVGHAHDARVFGNIILRNRRKFTAKVHSLKIPSKISGFDRISFRPMLHPHHHTCRVGRLYLNEISHYPSSARAP